MNCVEFKTTDLCDQYCDELQVCEPLFRSHGGQARFAGPAATIKCFEDNARVRELVNERGDGRVLVIDAGGSMRRAVLGDLLAGNAVENGWSGIIVFGAVRDAAALAAMPIGVLAIGTCPMKSEKRGEGQRDLTLRFAGATFHPGDWVYADEDGVVVARRRLP